MPKDCERCKFRFSFTVLLSSGLRSKSSKEASLVAWMLEVEGKETKERKESRVEQRTGFVLSGKIREVSFSLRPRNDLGQTGKYAVRAEDLPRVNNLPCTQRPIKRAKFEKYTCQALRYLQKGSVTYAEALRGWLF